MKVGVPRALLYHQYGECWTSFLDRLGVEAVVSEATSGTTVVRGAVYADNEACLPVKVFAGHLLELKGSADSILVPRVISQHPGMKACPKYLGLPDMARALDPDLPPVVSPCMDLSDRRRRWTGEWYQVARDLGASNMAANAAVNTLIGQLPARASRKGPGESGGIRVGVAGHMYNVHDQGVSLGLVERIEAMGAEVLTVEQVPQRFVRRELKTLPRKIKWEFESRIVGAAMHWSRTRSVSGIIYVSSFACGPGSMIGALLDDQFEREESVPLMTLILDEHSAEGGLVTRIEAFMDMLRHVLSARARQS
jgi:predicted nucleotide-binding protein (sugar kinase/HSP70/actin superfamily)